MSKSDLLEEARGLGLEASEKNTVAQLEKMILDSREVVITSTMNTVYVRRGEEKRVSLTPQIQALIDAGRLQVVE
jgi:hypothetical protein